MGLEVVPMTHNSELHVVYSGFPIPCLLNACFLLARKFFLAPFSKTPVPSPVADCGQPTKMCGAVSRYVCIYGLGGFMNLPSLSTHTYPAHVITMAQSQRIGITEVGSDSKVIE